MGLPKELSSTCKGARVWAGRRTSVLCCGLTDLPSLRIGIGLAALGHPKRGMRAVWQLAKTAPGWTLNNGTSESKCSGMTTLGRIELHGQPKARRADYWALPKPKPK